MSDTIYTVPQRWQYKIWSNPNALSFYDDEEKWETIMFELFESDYSGENNPFYGKTHTKEWKEKKSKSTKGKNNPMYGTKRGMECSNGGLYGDRNGMYKKGHLIKGKTQNKRMTCPLCGMESNSSNVKVHIKKTHELEWKDVLIGA